MTFDVKKFVPSNLQKDPFFEEMMDIIQYILGKNEVKLATSYTNAVDDITIDITDEGSGIHTLKSSLSNRSNTFTIDVANNILVLEKYIDLKQGTKVRIENSGGTPPAGLSTNTDYFITKSPSIASYLDVKNKYRDFLSLDNEIVQKIISELGYDYIVDVLQLMQINNVETKIFLGYIGIIHLLKGHRRGLELVFEILNIDYSLTEWWEKSPQGTPDTFDLAIDVDMSEHTFDYVDSMDSAIQAFAKQYVYPIFGTYVIKPTLTVRNSFYVGAIFLTGDEITILPPIEISIQVQSAVPTVGIGLILSETITISPPS